MIEHKYELMKQCLVNINSILASSEELLGNLELLSTGMRKNTTTIMEADLHNLTDHEKTVISCSIEEIIRISGCMLGLLHRRINGMLNNDRGPAAQSDPGPMVINEGITRHDQK
jgi:hypothetical protein